MSGAEASSTFPLRRALVSVSDKSGLAELAQALAARGVELVSTGGTARALAEAGVPCRDVADLTGFPEMFEGRVKTLHPHVHGGILYRRDAPDHAAAAEAAGIGPIDLVVVNLYPFAATAARRGADQAEIVEQIDIGGPALVRSAAKNHRDVAVLTSPVQYAELLAELEKNDGGIGRSAARRWAATAFAHTAAYDAAIAAWFAQTSRPADDEPAPHDADFPGAIEMRLVRQARLRYGENPHQRAALYALPDFAGPSVVRARQIHGKELSYNNLLDLDAALALVREFEPAGVAILKHNNPCGAATAATLAAAFEAAYESDPVSAFGCVVGCNRIVDGPTADAMAAPGRFLEAVVAPGFDAEALRILTTRPAWRANVRLLAAGEFGPPAPARILRPLEGGMLLQDADVSRDALRNAPVPTAAKPTPAQYADLAFAWTVVKHVRSNAIVVAKDGATLGVGAGQMSRVDAMKIALEKAGPRAAGAVLASDAFFPFRDNVDAAAAAGVAAIVQPGGSKRDGDSVAACDQHGLAMVFSGVRHFRH